MGADHESRRGFRLSGVVRGALTAVVIALTILGADSALRADKAVNRIGQVLVSPDLARVALRVNEGTAIHNLSDGSRTLLGTAMWGPVFSADGRFAALVSMGNEIALLDFGGGSAGERVIATGFERVGGVGISADGAMIFAADPKGRVALWSADGAAALWEAESGVDDGRRISFSADGGLVAIGGQRSGKGHRATVFDVASGRMVAQMDGPEHEYVNMVCFEPSAGGAASLLVQHGVGLTRWRFDAKGDAAAAPERAPVGGLPGIAVLASADAAMLTLDERGSEAHVISIWDIAAGKRVFSTPRLPRMERGAAYDAAQRRLAAVDQIGRARWWDTATGAMVREQMLAHETVRWQRRWTLLLAAGGVWLALWIGFSFAPWTPGRLEGEADQRSVNSILVPAMAVASVGVLAWLHVDLISHFTPRPGGWDSGVGSIGILPLVAAFSALAGIVMALISGRKQAWLAMLAAMFCGATCAWAAISLWGRYVASV